MCLNLRDLPTVLLGGGDMKPFPQSVPSRVIIEGVEPEIDGGQFPSKRTVGEEVVVAADVYADGHEVLAAVLRYRCSPSAEWAEVAMSAQPNDRWSASFTATEPGW